MKPDEHCAINFAYLKKNQPFPPISGKQHGEMILKLMEGGLAIENSSYQRKEE